MHIRMYMCLFVLYITPPPAAMTPAAAPIAATFCKLSCLSQFHSSIYTHSIQTNTYIYIYTYTYTFM